MWDTLSFEKKAGYFVWPSLGSTLLTPLESSLLETYSPSGLILFKRNFRNLSQARQLIAETKKIVAKEKRAFKLMIAIDEEGGRVSRLPSPFPKLRPPLEISQEGNKETLESQILLQAGAAKAIGINVLLAPVADILTEPTNPVLGDRCYGTSQDVVGEHALTVWKTLQDQNLFGCAKHFPGHGNTTTDSHMGFARSDVDLERLNSCEWLPFKKLIEAKIPMIMTAHVCIPSLDGERPATLSRKILQDYLRKSMGFSGLILSDDLRMNAVAHFYKQNKSQDSDIFEKTEVPSRTDSPNDTNYLSYAALDALRAGCDILLSCTSIEQEKVVFDAIATELARDKIFHEICREKAARIAKIFSVEP